MVDIDLIRIIYVWWEQRWQIDKFGKIQITNTCFPSEHDVLKQLLEFSSAYGKGALYSVRVRGVF